MSGPRGRAAWLLLATLALCGCESSQERNAELERRFHAEAARREREHPAAHGLRIVRRSSDVRVLAATLVHGSETNAAVLTLLSSAPKPLREVPIEITVRSSAGKVLFQNTAPGLAQALTSVPLLEPGRPFTWVDDQIPEAAYPGTVTAELGQVKGSGGPLPSLSTEGVHLVEDPASGLEAQGTVRNGSAVGQRELVIYGTATRAGKVVAAGRAVVATLAAHAASEFNIYFVGSPAGAKLTVSAPPTTFG